MIITRPGLHRRRPARAAWATTSTCSTTGPSSDRTTWPPAVFGGQATEIRVYPGGHPPATDRAEHLSRGCERKRYHDAPNRTHAAGGSHVPRRPPRRHGAVAVVERHRRVAGQRPSTAPRSASSARRYVEPEPDVRHDDRRRLHQPARRQHGLHVRLQDRRHAVPASRARCCASTRATRSPSPSPTRCSATCRWCSPARTTCSPTAHRPPRSSPTRCDPSTLTSLTQVGGGRTAAPSPTASSPTTPARSSTSRAPTPTSRCAWACSERSSCARPWAPTTPTTSDTVHDDGEFTAVPTATSARVGGANNDEEFMVLLSEIDPYLNQAIERQDAGQTSNYNLDNYHPRYWLVNGRGFPDSIADNGAAWLPNQPYGALAEVRESDDPTLDARSAIRTAASPATSTSGTETYPFHPHGNNGKVIGRDGNPLRSGRRRRRGPLVREVRHRHRPRTDLRRAVPLVRRRALQRRQPGARRVPQVANQVFGMFYSGSPYLGVTGAQPPGNQSLNQCGEYYIISHNHALYQITSWGVNMTGPITYMRIDPDQTTTTCPLLGDDHVDQSILSSSSPIRPPHGGGGLSARRRPARRRGGRPDAGPSGRRLLRPLRRRPARRRCRPTRGLTVVWGYSTDGTRRHRPRRSRPIVVTEGDARRRSPAQHARRADIARDPWSEPADRPGRCRRKRWRHQWHDELHVHRERARHLPLRGRAAGRTRRTRWRWVSTAHSS